MLRAQRAPGVEGGSSHGAAPTLVAAKLTNTELLEPLAIGDALIGLSGLIAIINGLRLAVAHKRQLTAVEVHTLMGVGLNYLSGRQTPRQAFQSGCRISSWRGMLAAIVEAARQRLDLSVQVERLIVDDIDRQQIFAVIEGSIERWRPVLMLCRGGRYMVVSGFTQSSLLVFDGAACWLTKSACGVPGDGDNARHLVIPASLTALRA